MTEFMCGFSMSTRAVLGLAFLLGCVVFPPHVEARQQYKPNLVVLDVSIAQSAHREAPALLFITIRNTSGAIGAGNSVTTVQHADHELFVDVPAIPRGHAVTVELPLTSCQSVLTIFADGTGLIDESSESDNTFESTVVCPVGAFGSGFEPTWNPETFQ